MQDVVNCVEMEKLKSNGEILDRLSELPDSLILEILSLLEMRDVVRTTLLSKRWKYLWTTVPCLEFSYCGRSNVVQIRNFVSRALTHWRGTCLRKFSILLWGVNEAASLSSDIDSWLLFAKEKKVEELFIRFRIHGELYCPPQCLYECSSLRKILLLGCDLQIRGNVQWDRLNWLMLSACCFTEDLLNRVLSSSPQLEYLELCYSHEVQNLSIRSSSLKTLWLSSRNKVSSVLTIWAPNLQTLMLTEEPYRKCLLTDVSSLTEVYLGFWANSSAAVAVEALCQILPAIRHVVTVRLSANCFKVLADSKDKYSSSPLLNVKLLKIGVASIEISKLVGVLEIFPKLKMLVIDWNRVGKLFNFNAEDYTMAEANILKSNLLQLRTAKVTWYSYEPSIFEFIEFLLKHATMIEKMVIQRTELKADKTDSMFLAAQKMVSLQKSFPNVELVQFSAKNY